jgi:hypothetical protein
MSSSNSHFEVVQGLTNKSRFRLCIASPAQALHAAVSMVIGASSSKRAAEPARQLFAIQSLLPMEL